MGREAGRTWAPCCRLSVRGMPIARLGEINGMKYIAREVTSLVALRFLGAAAFASSASAAITIYTNPADLLLTPRSFPATGFT